MVFKLGEIDDILDDVVDLVSLDNEMEIAEQESGEYQIWIETDCVFIPALGVLVFGAVSCIYDKGKNEYSLNSDLYKVYDFTTGKEVYFEYGSSLRVCIHNYCHFAGISTDGLEGLWCVYVSDGKRLLQRTSVAVSHERTEI